MTTRDADSGGCAQVRRFTFGVEGKKDFTFATKDNNLAAYIGNLIEAGVTSLKVEGRMRSLYYLATVIGTYREIIDRYYDSTLNDDILKVLEERLARVSNREVSTHYLLGEASAKDQYYTGRNEASNQDYLGQVISYDKSNKLVKIYERNYFIVGDTVELFTPKGDRLSFMVKKLYDEDMNLIDVARHPDNIYYIYLDTEVEIEEYSMIRLLHH